MDAIHGTHCMDMKATCTDHICKRKGYFYAFVTPIPDPDVPPPSAIQYPEYHGIIDKHVLMSITTLQVNTTRKMLGTLIKHLHHECKEQPSSLLKGGENTRIVQSKAVALVQWLPYRKIP